MYINIDIMYPGLSPEHLYLFFTCNNKKKLNFADIYDKRKKYSHGTAIPRL